MSQSEWSPEPLAVPAAYAVVVDHLRRAIHLGHYARGEKLPPERVLAPQLGVSRVTLREALRVLEGEGYVTTRRGSAGGATVRATTGSPETLRARLRAQRHELEALLEFRLVNEQLAAERAATRVDAADLETLADTIAVLETSDDVGLFRQADSAFHLRIARAAGCRLLEQAVQEARAEMFVPLDALDFEVMLATTVRGHQRILAALQNADPAKAGRAMAAHIKATNDEIDQLLRDD